MDNIAKELAEIGTLISHAHLMDAVRTEVRAAMKGQHASVIGGNMADQPEYEVAIKHAASEETVGNVVRRLRGSIKDIEIDRIADNIIGVRRVKA